jgi:multidrug transporter EmrE-like cation transporter
MLDTAKIVVLLSIAFIVIFEAFAQACLRKSERDGMSFLFFVGIACYAIVCLLLFNCYRNKGRMGNVNLLWSCFSIISIISIGYIFFEEKIYTHDMAAIFFAMVAIYFANQ